MSWSFPNDASDRFYIMSMGNAPTNGGSTTIIALVYATFTRNGIFRLELANTNPVYGMLADSGKWYAENDFGAGGPAVDQNVWTVIALTKPSGNTTSRWHKATGLGSSVSWQHVNGDSLNDGGTATQLRLFGIGTSNKMIGNIAAVAMYNTEMTDLQIEALGVTSMASWMAAGPRVAYQFNVNPTLTLTDLTGGGANQTNTPSFYPTLDTSNEPPNWAYYSSAKSSAFFEFF